MITVWLSTALIFCVLAFLLFVVETSGGTLGDSSMVPGLLALGVFVLVLETIIGVCSGQFGIWIK